MERAATAVGQEAEDVRRSAPSRQSAINAYIVLGNRLLGI